MTVWVPVLTGFVGALVGYVWRDHSVRDREDQAWNDGYDEGKASPVHLAGDPEPVNKG